MISSIAPLTAESTAAVGEDGGVIDRPGRDVELKAGAEGGGEGRAGGAEDGPAVFTAIVKASTSRSARGHKRKNSPQVASSLRAER